MSKVAFVTDSTVNFPAGVTDGLPIFWAPLQVIWDGQNYRDGVDVHPSEFYKRLSNSKTMPTTSQATPASFSELYRKLIDEDYSIISTHLSSKLSGTLDSAEQAKAEFPGAQIELIDSETTVMAMGFLILEAARLSAQGASLQECKEYIIQNRKNTGVLFVVNTLEFLRRGGRIGGAAAFLGTALNLKPILEVRDGRVEAVERVRTQGKALDRLLNLFAERVGSRRPVRFAAMHANALTECQTLLERTVECVGKSSVSEALINDISPVLGTHTGPGCLGLAFFAG